MKALQYLSACCFLVFLASCDRTPATPPISQRAKDAVLALKKLEAGIQVGITYEDYIRALGEAKFATNLFLDTEESKKASKSLLAAISNAITDYQFAGEIWKLQKEKTAVRVSDPEGQDIIGKLPDANKPMQGDLLKQHEANQLVRARQSLGFSSGDMRIAPLIPMKADGALFESRYLELEVVRRLIWLRAQDYVAQAYKLIA